MFKLPIKFFMLFIVLFYFLTPAYANEITYRDGSIGVIGGDDPTLKRIQTHEDSEDFFDLDRFIENSVQKARPVYKKIGQPRIVLYMNKVFSENVTDYFAQQRDIKSRELSRTGTFRGRETDYTKRQDNVKKTEVLRQRESPYTRPAQIFASRFKAGVSQILRRIPVKQVDQTAIQRFAAGDAEPTSLTLNEMKGLTQYADYIAEFLFVNDADAVSGFSIEMRLIRIKDALLVGIDLFEPQAIGETHAYEITENGFEEVIYLEVPTGKGIGQGAGATLLNMFAESQDIL